ncbi:D-cysteine desulfhydrase family protein [Clostridium culturomicium]|uniref:D-cysteine desulfhydrase family protein n=1 Tax=Clostridium culturomicium TaxID=1499683 RepID=UPI00385718E0
MKLPNHVALANLPTRIEYLSRFSKEVGANIYIKRDDFTGGEFSGNKVRKLEFAVQEALDRGCNTLITCGGIQSNHCRATAAVAARLGLKSVLVLRNNDTEVKPDGNYFIDKVLGADVRIISADEYKNERKEIMEKIQEECKAKGDKAYIIPEGASNYIGNFGYFKCMEEIKSQEEELGIVFDTIVIAVGSGGTYAGLQLANKVLNLNKKILGVNVCDTADFFKDRIYEIMGDSKEYLGLDVELHREEINIIDGYVGRGYALSRPEEIEFIKHFARTEGIILDPVYTGKGLYGLSSELKEGNLEDLGNILFIHTGGLYGLFPVRELFEN